MEFDFDFAVVGSGFGGSVSALRLAEKGYSVCVLEQGRHFRPEDFATSNWDVRRYLWAPLFKCFGIQNLSLFRDILILSGAGVGGGSLVYANTLMQPSDAFYNAPQWSGLGHWKEELAPHYATARRMLGAVRNPVFTFVDETLSACASEMKQSHTFAPTDVAVYFGEPGKKASDPYFGGEGPERSGCTLCGGCMVGCRHNAKNTLDKNYLYLARRKGAHIEAETRVVKIVPLFADAETHGKPAKVAPAAEHKEGMEPVGYELHLERSTAWFLKRRRVLRVRQAVLSAGVLGTLELLLKCKHVHGSLPLLSNCLGQEVRTNSEVFTGVTEFASHTRGRDYSKGVAISSIFQTDAHTSIEPVRYPKGSSFMRLLAAPLVEEPREWLRPFKLIARIASRPVEFLRLFFNPNWAETSLIFLVMQNLDNRVQFSLRRSLWSGFRPGLSSRPVPGAAPIPSEIPSANRATRLFASKVGGVAQCAISQVTINIPTTAHILGGCSIGENPAQGVINARHEVFGYPGLYVCDGSAIPANLGVNPSLTITAMSERAMSFIPAKKP